MAVSLLCIIGIPGSGKTTLARAITNYIQDGQDGEVVVFEYDSYIEENVYTQGKWKSSRNNLLIKIENSARELAMIGRKSLVILDDNFYYRSMRYEVYKVSKKLQLGFGQVFLDVPLEICLSRNQNRTNSLSPDTIMKMNEILEPPEPSRNSWETQSVRCSGPPDLDMIHNLISWTWENPCVEDSQPELTPQENSNVHFADLALRQIIKSMVQSTPRDQLPNLTRELALKKKRILEDIKTRNLILPDSPVSNSASYTAFLEPYMTS